MTNPGKDVRAGHEWLPDEVMMCCSCGESCHTPTSLMAYAREECKKWHAAHVASLAAQGPAAPAAQEREPQQRCTQIATGFRCLLLKGHAEDHDYEFDHASPAAPHTQSAPAEPRQTVCAEHRVHLCGICFTDPVTLAAARVEADKLLQDWHDLSARLVESPTPLPRNDERAEAFDDAAEEFQVWLDKWLPKGGAK